MGQDQEKRHVCKLCKKSFLSGRMLGGHMRGHGNINSAEDEVKLKNSDEGFEGYGLRENPKKSWRFSCLSDGEGVSVQERVKCRVCGKEFGSLKSLYGHMRLHSAQEKTSQCKQCGKLFKSLKCLSNHMRSHSEKFRDGSRPNLVVMTLSESDTASVHLVRRKRSTRVRCTITPNSSSSSLDESASDFEIEQEVEEVAMCLIMMSKGKFGGFNSLYDSKKNEGLDGGDIPECDEAVQTKKARVEKFDCCASDSKLVEEPSESSHVGVDSKMPELERGSGGEFKCRICNKSFLTYQSLGGHQTLHRTAKSCAASKIDSLQKDDQTEFLPEIEATDKFPKLKCIQDSVEKEMSGVMVKCYEPKKGEEHKCAICLKIFASGQALGGHKRAHVAKAREEEAMSMRQEVPNSCNVFDINLPYMLDAEANDQDAGLNSWWTGSGSNHEPLVGLIAH